MSSTLDRLRRLQSLRPQRTRPEPVYVPLEDDTPLEPPRPRRLGSLAELTRGVEIQTPMGPCFLVTTAHPLDTLRGAYPLGALLRLAPAGLAPFHPEFALEDQRDFQRAIFFDTETTGLGGGASVYAFMVGVGAFETLSPEATRPDDLPVTASQAQAPTHFVVRQFFMRHPGEEAAVLTGIATLFAQSQLGVTFNGRAFDAPLLRARYLQNRRFMNVSPQMTALLQAESPHLDLLLPARRLWRRRLESCRLIHLEQTILGIRRTEDDVPGALIPQLYQEFLRTGQGDAMAQVFYHNREDIVSMVSLAHRLLQAYTTPIAGAEVPAVQGADWVALGILYERQGEHAAAEIAYRRAIEAIVDDVRRSEAFRCLGDLCKRQSRWAEAASIWEQWLQSTTALDVTPFVELAKYCEWQTADLDQAEMWTRWAIHNLQAAPAYQRPPGQLAELEHRLARLQRKQAK